MGNDNNRRLFFKKIAISGIGVSIMPLSYAHLQNPLPQGSMGNFMLPGGGENEEVSCWLESSLNRIFPQSPAKQATQFDLLAARNSRISFQVCFRNNTIKVKKLKCRLENADDLKPVVRLVGLVPMRKFTPLTEPAELDGIGYYPGLCPDPLLEVSDTMADPFASRSFWVTLNIPAEIQPGNYDLKVDLTWENGNISLPLTINITQLVVRPREGFDVTHWWRGEATWNYYKTEMFDDRWWSLTKAQMTDMLDHGSNVVNVPVLFILKPVFKRPCQLLIVDEPSPGKYLFDWSRVKKFVAMCKEIGFKKFEWSHLWVYWGVKNPTRIYKKVNDEHVMLWAPDISGFSDTFINFLKQFLPEFHQFLLEEKVLKNSYFHLSDEPGGKDIEDYHKAKNILNDLAPWMHPIMDALSNIKYGRESLVDIPIPKLSNAKAFLDEKISHWVYFCCDPRGNYLNRFFDTPLPKLRMSGWLFFHLKAQGFLHWGYNYWNKLESEEVLDPFNNGDAGSWPGIPYGDPFVVYPGPDGPLSSIRWEVFAESLQDYAILQTAGISPDDKRFSDLRSYEDFPKTEKWIQKALSDVLK